MIFSFLLFLLNCFPNYLTVFTLNKHEEKVLHNNVIETDKDALRARFKPPAGYKRIHQTANSFGHYLQNLPLKAEGSFVSYYDGRLKSNPGIYAGVVDLPIGNKNLHQCADAVMRLRAEYLFKEQRYSDIHFNFLSDGKPRYYESFVNGDHGYPAFWKYMEHIFEFANTTSLANELVSVSKPSLVKTGDVLIEKKSPYGHAVIIVDIAIHSSGKKLVLLAQSYMPAQEIQILTNPNNSSLSPWYELKNGQIETPEWSFKSEHLRRFR